MTENTQIELKDIRTAFAKASSIKTKGYLSEEE